MYFTLLDTFDAILGFMNQGGEVLWVIAGLLLLMWSLVFERVWYLHSSHAKRVKQTLAAWNSRTDTGSWRARQIRNMMISQVSLDLKSSMPMIESLVMICPLLGLIGTVTGMIEVFYVMALTGGGDAKSMAGGVSKATIPTMAGMVGALSGIFAANWLKHRMDRDIELLEDNMALNT
jgi:biopolymer transport protein ExbB